MSQAMDYFRDAAISNAVGFSERSLKAKIRLLEERIERLEKIIDALKDERLDRNR